jgi:hypothetical protein
MSLPRNEVTYTDRDILRDEIERMCVISGKFFIERDTTITVIHGPKFIFTAEGEIKSIIRDGKAYGPDGQRHYVPPKGSGK